MIRVLYVDDEEDLLILGKEFLEMSGDIEVDTLDSAEAAQARLASSRYDAVVSDYQMPEVNGIEFLKRLRSQGDNIPFILFTGRGREEVVIEALNAGANFYLQKGGKVEAQFAELRHKLKEAVKRREAEMELARLNRELLAIKEISKLIIRARTEKHLLEETCRIACQVGGYMLAWVGYLEKDEACSIRPVAWSGHDEAYVRGINASWADVAQGQGPTGVAARTGKTTFIQDWEGNESISPWRRSALDYGYRSSISLPIKLAQGTVGILSLYSGIANGFTRNEIRMLEEMVDDLAYGIENLRIQEEKSRAEAAMRESEEKFFTAFHGSVAAMCLLRTRDDILLDVNERYARMSGYEREEMIGCRLGDLGIWSEEGQAERLAAQFKSARQIVDQELALQRKDGRRWTALFSAKLVSLGGEEIILASQIDITGRKQAEEALELERRKFASGMDMAHMAYWEYDAIADQYTFDDRFYALLGTSVAAEGPHKTYQQYIEDFVHPEDREALIRQVQEHVDSDFPLGLAQYEHRVVRRDGQVRDLLVKVEVIRDGSGKAVRTAGVNQDVTEQKAAKMRLEGSERDFRAFVEESAEGLSLMNADGRMTEWNAAMASITGISREEALGQYSWDLSWSMVPGEARQFVTHEMMHQQIAGMIDSGQAPFLKNRMVTQIKRRDGQLRTLEQMVFPISIGSSLHYGSIVRDVTEAKRTEKLLQESEKKYRDIVNATNDAIFVADMQGNFMEINDAACHQLGYTRKELICRGPATICPPELAARATSRMKEAVERGHIVFETVHVAKDGSRIPVEVSAQKLIYQGSPALLGVVRDISERRRVLEALEQSEEKYRVIFNNELYAICIFDIGTLRFLDANEAFERMYGHTKEELLSGMTIHDVTAQHQESDAATEQASSHGTVFIPLRYHRRKDGTVIPVEIVGGPYVWQGKRVMFALFHDISDRVRAEKALKESEARFREIFYHASDAINVHERQADGRPGKLIDFNDVAAEMLGYTREEMLAKPPMDVNAAFHDPPLEKVLESLRLRGRARFETELVRKDGSRVPVEVSSHVLVQHGDEVMISLVRDVTEKKRAMNALRLANKKLSLLTSITRHDMNNSLIALRGNVELLKVEIPELEENPRIRAIAAQAKRLDGMVSFTKSYESFGTVEPSWHDLRQMVGEASSEVQWGDATLVNDVPAGVQVLVDPLAVKVLVNLMDNSLRHGEKVTHVDISCRADGSSLEIVCQDDGVGIPWGEKEKVFELGYGRNTGLGLFLSREVLDLTGISVVENGEPGKGARFVIKVPAGHFRR